MLFVISVLCGSLVVALAAP
ncbi:hypothetical protein B9J80_06595 [Vibrio sp. V12_P9A6T4]|nr:hypothetical protein B9J80_06595 [Vibrio sp. V12_P9A6T4]